LKTDDSTKLINAEKILSEIFGCGAVKGVLPIRGKGRRPSLAVSIKCVSYSTWKDIDDATIKIVSKLSNISFIRKF
jgi:hypothetical protein